MGVAVKLTAILHHQQPPQILSHHHKLNPLSIPRKISSINNLSCRCASTAAAASGEVIKEDDLIEPLEVDEIKGICSKWVWKGYTINYLKYEGQNGGDKASPPPVLLVHGFGASVAHWRRYLSVFKI